MMARVGMLALVAVAALCFGTAAPAAAQQCCACDFTGVPGFLLFECGTGDTNCAECIQLGGQPAAFCAVCEGDPACIGNTDCGGEPTPRDFCCACDFGEGPSCIAGDINCAFCLASGGVEAACSVCSSNPGCAGTGTTVCEVPKPAPAASRAGITVLAALLAAVGVVSLGARRWRRS